jgi:hypothetical protein
VTHKFDQLDAIDLAVIENRVSAQEVRLEIIAAHASTIRQKFHLHPVHALILRIDRRV